MRVLVVGATGVVGRQVCALLAGRGHEVRGLVRSTSDPAARASLEAAGVAVVEGDLRHPQSLASACDGVDAVISTASAIGSEDPDNSLGSVDQAGQAALIDAAAAAGVDRFIFVSVFGLGPDSPFQQGKKATADRIRSSGMTWTIIRPSVFMDTWLSPHTGFDWAGGGVTIYGDGESAQSWVHSSDVAAAIVDALQSDAAVNADVKVLGPEALTPNQVVSMFEEMLGTSLEKTHVPVEHLEAQRSGAGHPVEQSFAALMIRYAQGDPDEPDMPQVGNSRVSVRDYIRTVTG